jgi:NAD(P)-dependent dehydrogenase (short-subunit alcohol dehydrogenase family)
MKRALITGGAGRLGSAIAKRLAADGWQVVLADKDGKAAEATAKAIGTNATAIALDITDLAAIEQAVTQHGPFAGLVNAAGGRFGANVGAFTDSDPTTWRAIVELQLKGVLNSCRSVLPGMIAAKDGGIVNIAAIEGLRGHPQGAIFSACKGGVIVLTETLVRECRPHGIRVNALLPGNPASLAKSQAADDAADVAEMATFLLSDKAARTTGATIDVTAGWSLH